MKVLLLCMVPPSSGNSHSRLLLPEMFRLFRMFEALFAQNCEIVVGIHGKEIDRKDARMSEITRFHSVRTHSCFNQNPDDIAKKFKNMNCVIFDSPDTERLFSKSFHLYADPVLQVLDLVELESMGETRQGAYLQKKSLEEIAATKADASVS